MSTVSFIPKSVLIFLFLQAFLFGYDYGIINLYNPKWKFKYNIYRVILFFVFLTSDVCYILTYDFKAFLLAISFFNYSLCVFIAALTKYTVCDFLRDIGQYDENVLKVTLETPVVVTYIYILLGIAAHVKVPLHYTPEGFVDSVWHGYELNLFISHISILYQYSNRIINMIMIIIYYFLLRCARCIKALIETPNSDVDEITKRYINMIHCQDNIEAFVNIIFSAEVLGKGPFLFKVVYDAFKSLAVTESNFTFYSRVFALSFNFGTIFWPSTIIDMFIAKLEAVDVALDHRVLLETDKEVVEKLCRLRVYAKNRRPSPKVFRRITVDLMLPLTLLKICITYAIVLVQLKHLYE